MRKENITWRALKQYHSYHKPYFPLRFLQILFQVISPYFNLWMSAEIVTSLYEGREQKTVYTLVAVTLAGNLLIGLSDAILGRMVDTARRTLENNETAAFNRKTISLDYDKLENPKIRALRRRIQENACINSYGVVFMRNLVESFFEGGVHMLFSVVFFAEMLMKIVGAGMHLTSLLLLLVMVLFIGISAWYSKFVQGKLAEVYKSIGEVMLEENRISEGFSLDGMDARIYCQQKLVSEIDKKMNEKHKQYFSKANSKDTMLGIPSRIFSKVPEACAYLIVGYYCIIGIFPVGGVIKYVGYLSQVTRNLLNLFYCVTSLKTNEPFLDTYMEYFDIKNDMYQGSLAVEKRSDKQFDIAFKNVTFCYAGTEEPALKNINLNIKVGERLAVVGMNGSGKTTFIKLLCRLYDPTEGEIIMNDFNVRKYDYRQYLDLFSVVFQDYNLLALPLGNNVACAAGWDAEKAERLLTEVGFGERYAELTKKLETPLYKNFDEDGVNISGGEAQKIALARALYRDAPFIILDEPTAALDPIAEAEIYSRFDEIVGDKTAIYISHRLSSCRFCDKIAVFDRGEKPLLHNLFKQKP